LRDTRTFIPDKNIARQPMMAATRQNYFNFWIPTMSRIGEYPHQFC
jgi:hypothetical protein